MPAEKVCSGCGRSLPLEAFHRRRHNVRSGVRARCKACTAEDTRRARLEGRRPAPDRMKERVRARTRYAERTGKLTREPCARCGALDVQAHHRSYDRPDSHLDVEYLCAACHALEHGVQAWTNQLELPWMAQA